MWLDNFWLQNKIPSHVADNILIYWLLEEKVANLQYLYNTSIFGHIWIFITQNVCLFIYLFHLYFGTWPLLSTYLPCTQRPEAFNITS